jgi:hypothetical protein
MLYYWWLLPRAELVWSTLSMVGGCSLFILCISKARAYDSKYRSMISSCSRRLSKTRPGASHRVAWRMSMRDLHCNPGIDMESWTFVRARFFIESLKL